MGKGQSKSPTRQAYGAQSSLFKASFRRRESSDTRNFSNIAPHHSISSRWGLEHEAHTHHLEEDWVLVTHRDASHVRPATTSRNRDEDVARLRQAPNTYTTSRAVTNDRGGYGLPEQGAPAITRLGDNLESGDVVGTQARSREPTSYYGNSHGDRNSTIPANGRYDSVKKENTDKAGERRTLGITSARNLSSEERGVGTSSPLDVSSGSVRKENRQSQHSNVEVLRGMRDNLMCPIHLGLLQRPKTLPCQHVICEECIGKWFKMKSRLICPTCNSAHPTPTGGIANLPDNFVVNNLVQEMEKVEDEGDISSDLQAESVTPKSSLGDVDVALSFLEKVSKTYNDVPGANVELRVQMCDSDGNCIRSEGACAIEGAVCCPCGRKESISITFRRQKGDYTVTFVPTVCGLYTVEVLMSNTHVVGSPMQVVVRPLGTLTSERRTIPGTPKGVVNTGSGLFATGWNDMMYLKIDTPVSNTMANTGEVIFSTVKQPAWSKEGQINPFGIATWNNRCFITDTTSKCVHIYTSDTYTGSFNGNGVLQGPTGIALNKHGWIFVSDSTKGNIEVFSANLFHQRSLRIGQRERNGKVMSSLSQLVLNHTQDKLIVVDQAMNCLRIFDLSRSKLFKVVKTKVKQSQATPSGITVDRYDNILVSVTYQSPSSNKDTLEEDLTDEKRGAVLMYNSNGFFLGRFGERELYDPRCLCMDRNLLSHVIVVDNEVASSDSEERDTEAGECSLKVFKIC